MCCMLVSERPSALFGQLLNNRFAPKRVFLGGVKVEPELLQCFLSVWSLDLEREGGDGDGECLHG